MAARRAYATTRRGLYLHLARDDPSRPRRLSVQAAAADGLAEVTFVRNGEDVDSRVGDDDPRIAAVQFDLDDGPSGEFFYVRVRTAGGHLAWSCPLWPR